MGDSAAVSAPGPASSLPLSGFLWNTVNILHRSGVVGGSTVMVVPVISFVLEVGGAGVPALILISLPLLIGIFLSIF